MAKPEQLGANCYVGHNAHPVCSLTLACASAECKQEPAPTPGAGSFPDVNGKWKLEKTSSCFQVPQFARTFTVSQCGGNLVVRPNAYSQKPNAGTITAGGLVTVGTFKGSTTKCTLLFDESERSMSGSCTYNGQPLCSIALSEDN